MDAFQILRSQAFLAREGDAQLAATALQKMSAFAQRILAGDERFAARASSRASLAFVPRRSARDDTTTTLKFSQKYAGIEALGEDALLTFDADGGILEITGNAIDTNLSAEPKLTAEEARQLLSDRYQTGVTLSDPAELRVMKDFDGAYRLAYLLKTATSDVLPGREVYLDAHDGAVLIDAPRARDLLQRTVLSAATPEARRHVDSKGAPTDLNFAWYEVAVRNSWPRSTEARAQMDRSVYNAFRNAGLVYGYYRRTFARSSYDDRDSPIVSVVHAGVHYDNAFWSEEFKCIVYGDGDGRFFGDMTAALDVAGHELTHAVTETEANLIYAGEPGALNESYSDFFGKMIDFRPNDWNIGAAIMGEESRRKNEFAIRNMLEPERYGQPGSTNSPKRVPTTARCNKSNDNCGVHVNSGIPNRAAALIVNAIGKAKAERLYYNVLTQRLRAGSTFREARLVTESACAIMYGGTESFECRQVRSAFSSVRM